MAGLAPAGTMIARERRKGRIIPAYMKGGPNNPLGARALYLYKGGRDTIFRIHGTNQPWTIGQNMSSGCIRMMNKDVEHLYKRAACRFQGHRHRSQRPGGRKALHRSRHGSAGNPFRRLSARHCICNNSEYRRRRFESAAFSLAGEAFPPDGNRRLYSAASQWCRLRPSDIGQAGRLSPP
jgi:hypothetical protein